MPREKKKSPAATVRKARRRPGHSEGRHGDSATRAAREGITVYRRKTGAGRFDLERKVSVDPM